MTLNQQFLLEFKSTVNNLHNTIKVNHDLHEHMIIEGFGHKLKGLVKLTKNSKAKHQIKGEMNTLSKELFREWLKIQTRNRLEINAANIKGFLLQNGFDAKVVDREVRAAGFKGSIATRMGRTFENSQLKPFFLNVIYANNKAEFDKFTQSIQNAPSQDAPSKPTPVAPGAVAPVPVQKPETDKTASIKDAIRGLPAGERNELIGQLIQQNTK